MNIDLTAIEAQMLQALAIILLGIGLALARLIAKLLNLQFTAEQSGQLEDVAGKSLAFGIVQAKDMIAAKGWDHADVKNAVVATAAQYAIAQFPKVLAKSGFDLSAPDLTEERLANTILTRKFPDAMTAAAPSPATPPAPMPANPK
jgi:hypothetical protein